MDSSVALMPNSCLVRSRFNFFTIGCRCSGGNQVENYLIIDKPMLQLLANLSVVVTRISLVT